MLAWAIPTYTPAYPGYGAPPALVVMGSEVPFPFSPGVADAPLPGIPATVAATMPDLASLGVPTRLASTRGYDGCFDGFVTDAAAAWLDAMTPAERAEVAVYACGPNPMLAAVAGLAAPLVIEGTWRESDLDHSHFAV